MQERVPRYFLAFFLLLGLFGAAHAEDQRLAGSKLVLRKSESTERLVLVARDGVVAPLPGGAEDPTLVGALLEISNPRTGERARFEAPSRGWSVNAIGTVFRFRNRIEKGPGSEVRAIVIKHQRRLKISARAIGITLDEESQRALSVVVTSGTRRYCLLFGGKIGKDKPGSFAARRAPAPIACPAPIVASSTTTTSRPPGTGPTTSSVTSSTNVTNSTGATSSTSVTSSTLSPFPLGSTTSTTPSPTTPGGSSTSTTRAPSPTTSSTTSTVRPTTSSSTSTSSSTTRPPAPTTSSTTRPPTTSTSPPPPTTSSTSPPPPTTSTSVTVATTSTTTPTARQCGRRGNSCNGHCPLGLDCRDVLGLCACFPP